MTSKKAELMEGSVVGQRYQVGRCLRKGRGKRTYFCRDLDKAQNRLILKVMDLPESITESPGTWSQDFSLLRRIQHPHLVRVVDFGKVENSRALYFIEERIEGKDLILGTEGMDIQEILFLLEELFRTVQYLHTQRMVHGSLKPSNIFLSSAVEGSPGFRLTDFGISGPFRDRSLNEWDGMLPYTAPECLLGKHPDEGSDIYSLGILTYQTIIRKLPFEDEDSGFLIQKHLQGHADLRPVERLQGGRYLSRLLQGLLDKDTDKRLEFLDKTTELIRSAQNDEPSKVFNTGMPESSFLPTRLIGREKEMEFLQDHAKRVRENKRGWTVFISGEAGSGKTRCMEELKCWGLLEGWRVIEGRCSLQEEGSYSPYRQILAKAQPDRKEEIFQFGETLHSGRKESFNASLDYAAGQFRDLLTRELVRHLSQNPTILLLDDFHEADEATSMVLDYLSSDIQVHPVFMCVGLRSGEETGDALARAIAGLVRQRRGEVLALEPLSRESVENLVSVMTGVPRRKTKLGSWMFQRVGGNPFFLEEMLKHLVEQGLLLNVSGQWRFNPEKPEQTEVPDSVGNVIKQRFRRLSALSRETADYLAVINRAVSMKLLNSAIPLKPNEISRSIEELVHRQMVLPEIRNGEETIGFCHALTAEVIRSCLSDKKRRGMHRRIAEAFESEYGDREYLPELARHSMNGKLGEKAVRYALLLASQARREFSHETAAHCFEYVLGDRRHLDSKERCHVSIDAADTFLVLGNPKRAIRLLKVEIAKNRNIEKDLKGRMYMQLALSCQHLGDFAGQELYCKKGLRLYHGSSCPGKNLNRAMLYTELAFGAAIQSHTKRGLVYLKKALDACPASGSDALLGRIQIFTATNHLVACKLHDSLLAIEKAERILINSDDSFLSCSAYSTHGIILLSLGRFSQSLTKHEYAVKISDKSRSVIPRAQALGNLAECLCRLGRTGEALKALESAMKLVGESENPAIHHALNAILVEIRIAENDYAGAHKILHRIDRKAGNNLALYAVGHAHYLAASLYFTLGDFDTAAEHIQRLRRMETAEAPCYEHELAEALEARILFEHNREEEAVKRLNSLDRSVAGKRWPYHRAIVKLHLGEILLKQENLKEADRHIRNGLRLARGMHSASLVDYGRLLSGILFFRRWRKHAKGFQDGSVDRNARHKTSDLNMAMEELLASCRFTEMPGNKEVAWRAHTELSALFGSLKNEEKRLYHARTAYDCLCRLENRVPREMLPSFRNAFNRKCSKSELSRLIEAVKKPEPGMDVIVSGEQDTDQTRILYRASATVNTIRDLDLLLEAILDQLIQAMNMERALVFLNEGSRGKWKPAKGRSNKKESITTAVTVSPLILNEVGRKGNPVVSADVGKDPRLTGKRLTVPGEPGRLLCAPLKVSGNVIGLLYADHSLPVAKLNESAINLFAAFCNLSAIAIDSSIAQQKLFHEKEELEQFLHQVREEYAEIVGTSPAAEALRDRIAVVAASPLDVLIVGESGTGKELVAQAIHRTCRRSSGRFIAIDCGSLSDTLAEAELFGCRKGAFTGAVEDRQGLLEAANGGILFLDEISNLPFQLQAKFLRVLEQREVRRVGDTVTRKIDIQVIAATNKDLRVEIENGSFRADLFYRLKKMEIRVPPLRERLEDVPLLVQSFLAKTSDAESGRMKSVSSRAMSLLKAYAYPGNIRELLNAVTGAWYSTAGNIIDEENLPPEIRPLFGELPATDSDIAGRLYRELLEGKGGFEDRIKIPFLQRRFSTSVVRGVVERALEDSGGRYRDAFVRLGIPDQSYSVTLQFLKRHRCYLDFRPFRKRGTSKG